MKTQIEKAMQWFNEQGITAFITNDKDGDTLTIVVESFEVIVSDNEIAYRAMLWQENNLNP